MTKKPQPGVAKAGNSLMPSLNRPVMGAKSIKTVLITFTLGG